MAISIIQCPDCGEIQGALGKKIFSCKICGSNRQMKHVKILGKVNDPQKAREEILKLKLKKIKKMQKS